MSRNLLPRLRRAPNPANIPSFTVADWQTVTSPSDLAKLDYGNSEGAAPRARLQSVPSPWARMLLFRNALEEESHPARTLVENEILDGLEFLWSAVTIVGGRLDIETVRMSDLRAVSHDIGSQRVENLGDALVDLVPTTGQAPAFESLTIVTGGGRPVLATSPYTLIFTAEDAAGSGTSEFFTFKSTGADRPLASRQKAFQQYIATVVLPQLESPQPSIAVDFDWLELRRLVAGWLQKEIRAARLTSGDGSGWRNSADRLHLTSLATPFAGVQLFQRSADVGQLESRWRVRPSRKLAGSAPLLLDRTRFDGAYYEGATPVSLPANLALLDRAVLPVTNVRHPWVDPTSDWFSPRLVLLDEPLNPDAVLGLKNYSAQGATSDYVSPRLALPLTSAFFALFTPQDLDHMLRISVDGDRVECTLRVPVGRADDEYVEVSRVYTAANTAQTRGPSLTLWPRFADSRWHSYLVFRRDGAAAAGPLLALGALDEDGQLLTGEHERRNDVVETIFFPAAPRVLVLQDTTNDTALGVVIPRYTSPARTTDRKLDVGVDFGTSNTVISLREEGASTPALLELKDVVLPLTKATELTDRYVAAYFFPREIKAAPFGTAAVHLKTLGLLQLENNALGVRVNVPFDGEVEPDSRNTVVGDLKWSSEREAAFLTESFLRHIIAVVLAYAIDSGFDPALVRIRYAYPRAFSERQSSQLNELWKRVWRTFEREGQQIGTLREPLDESRAMLHHFYNAGVVGVAGETTALLDIGGGTSDIAVYRGGQALALDSLMLGGRNLTGARFQGADKANLRNAFVAEFVRWARANGLAQYPSEQRAVQAYMDAAQDHLAFTYLLGTEWYQANGYRFTGDRVAHQFQAAVLYLFGGLFYYLGLTARDISRRIGVDATPRKIVLAGNGSRYVGWLTGGGLSRDSVFQRFFGNMIRRAADPPNDNGDGVAPLVIEMSELPKQEVARGLVGQADPSLGYANASSTPLVGESITLPRVGEMAASDRLRDTLSFDPDDVCAFSWQAGEAEIDRFHAALLKNAEPLMTVDPHWSATINELRSLLRAIPTSEIQERTRARIEYLATTAGGFRGSFFAVEIATVLELLMDGLLPRTATSRPAASPVVAS